MSDFDTPAACEAAFYAAFEAGDVDAMMTVWAERAPLLCVHPAGPPITSRSEVAESWRRILTGGGDVRFTLSHRQTREDGALAVRFVHENIHHGPGYRETATVLATNVFVREGASWRLCAHHASPGPPTADAPQGGAVH